MPHSLQIGLTADCTTSLTISRWTISQLRYVLRNWVFIRACICYAKTHENSFSDNCVGERSGSKTLGSPWFLLECTASRFPIVWLNQAGFKSRIFPFTPHRSSGDLLDWYSQEKERCRRSHDRRVGDHSRLGAERSLNSPDFWSSHLS